MAKKGRIGDRYRKIKISNEKIKQRNKKEYAKIIVLAAFLLIITIGGSYALFQTTITGNKQTEVVAGTLKVEYEDKNTISLNNASPLTDVEGLKQEPYTFTIRNIGTLNGKYTIYLEEKEGNTLDKSNIKYSIKEGDGNWSSPVLLSSGLVLKENRILEKNQEETYQIKMWLKEDAANEVQGQTYKAKVVVNVVQTNTENIVTTNPVIKLNGESVVKVNQNDLYTDAGVSSVSSREEISLDKVKIRYEYNNGKITESVERIDTSKVGIYYIYYEVEDSKGIKGISTRVVNVIKKGTNIPTIVLKGEEEISLGYKEKYIEAGYEARDAEDGELTDKVVVEGVVNSEVAGTYIIKYIVIDSEGATASVVRKVIVNGKSQSLTAIVNKEAKENISTSLEIEAETDSDKVYYAVTTTDKKPGDSEYKELVNKRVSLNIVKNGRYYIFIKDSKGNITKKEIEVTNIDETKPSCSFEEGGYVEKGKTKEIGLTCTDPADIATTKIEQERIEVSDSEVGAVESITAGEKIDQGYKYKVTVRGKNSGNFTLKLKANSVLDKVGNKNEEVNSTNVKVVEMILGEKEIKLDLTGTNEKQIEISGTNIGNLSYESNNKEIAIVTEEGIVRAVSPGVTTITVTEANSGITTQIKVTVVKTLTAYFTKDSVGIKSISKTVTSCTIEDNSVSCNIELPLMELEEKYGEDGWYKETERVGKSGDEYTLSDDNTTNGKVTLTAKAKLKEYTVTYDYATNGGTAASKTSDKVVIGSSIDLTPSATKAGYTFAGWNTSKDAKVGLTELTMGNGNITVYAIYKKEVSATFYYYDGTKQATTTASCTVYNKEASCNYTLPTVVKNSTGPESSTYKGVSDKASSTTPADLDSTTTKYYAYYLGYWKAKFNNQNNTVSTIDSTNSSCESYKTTDGKMYDNPNCQITLPNITITNTDYSIGGWNTEKDATSGISAQEKVAIGSSTVNDAADSFTTNFYTIIGKKPVTRVATFNKNGASSQTDINNQASTATTVTRSCTIPAISNIASQTQATTCSVITPTIVGSSNTPTVLGYNISSSATLASVLENTSLSLNSNATYYAITMKEAVKFTANWDANSATLSTTNQSSCNISATYNGAVQATSCTVAAPTITAPSVTPTILGYNTSKNSNSNNSSYNRSNKLLTLNSSNTGKTWYAQTKKDVVSYTIGSYNKGSNVSSIGAKTDTNSKCTINATYNGVAQATSCTVTAPEVTANTGYTSVGWNLTSGATTGSSVITLNSSNTGKTWYANATANSYTINYYDGTTLKGSSSAKVDTYPTLTKASSLSLSKTGYTFKGWATTNGGTVIYTDGQKLTANLATKAGATVNLYAVWKDETAPVCSFSGASATTTQNTTTITLNCTDSGSGIVQKTLSIADFSTTANGSVIAVSAPVKVTNGYSYTVTLKGLSVGTFTVSLKAGLISDVAGNSNAVATSGNVTVNGRTYTVTFSKGSNVSTISSTSSSCTTTGSSLTCTIGTYPTITAATGYSATTWYDSTAKKDTGIASGGSGSGYAIGQNTTMTAQAKANTYTINYNANGGSGTMASTIATYDSTTTISANTFTKTGYSFAGWTTKSDGTDDGYGWTNWSGTWKYVNGQYGISGGKLVLYARWSANTYTIKYDANGGTGASANQSFVYNSGAKISTTKPTRTGYTFVNWKYGDITFNPGDAVPTGWGDFTLQAQWTVNSYTVTYDKNGGDSVSKASTSVNYNSAIDLTPTASKSGYEFIGWNTAKNATTALSSLKMGTSNVTLYAIYKKIVTIPTSSLCTSPTYNGDSQQLTSVTSGDGYTLSGYNGTNAGNYTVTASLKGFSRWSDGTTDNKTFTCSINKKVITVTASSGSKTYDGSSLTNVSGCSVTSGSIVSGHTVTCSNSGSITNKGSAANTISSVVIKSGTTDVSGNYSITKVNGALTIKARSTTCTSASSSKGYNGSALINPTGGSCTNLVSGHSATFTNTGSITNVGTTPNTISSVVIKSGTTDVSGNYVITKVNGTLTVTKVAATNPTLTAYSGVYDGSSHTIGVSGGSGGTIEYSTDNKTWTTTKPTRTSVGTTTVYVKVTGDSNHNTTTAISSTITITRKPISVPTCGSKTYTGTSQTLFTSGTEYTAGGTTSGIDAGTYTATATPTGNYMWTDKTTTAKNVSCTINPKSVAVSWGTTSAFTYNGSAQAPSASAASGVSGETINVGRTTGTNAGSYTSTASCSSVSGGRAKCSNYKLTGSTKGFSIDRASMTKPSSPAAKNYTGSSQGSGITCPSGSTTGGTTSATNAGTYSQTCTPDSNHQWSGGATTVSSISWTINKVAATISCSNKTYTGASQTGCSCSGGTIGGTTSAIDAGTYTVSCSPDSNHTAPANKSWSIGAKSVAVSWGTTSAFTYNGSAQAPSASAASGVSGETINVGRTTGTNAGSYTSTASCSSVSGGRAKCSNYKLTGSTKGFSIDRASMTKPSSPAAKNYTGSSQGSGITCPSGSTTGGTTSATNAGTYSQTCSPDANHKWSDGTTSAATISWTINKVAATISCSNKTYTGTSQTGCSCSGGTIGGTTSAIDVGTYTVSCSPDSNHTAPANKSWSIGAKSVAVSWGTTSAFTYNGSAQAPSASAASGVSGETINVGRTTGTNAGSYTSTASCSSVSGGRAKCSNYKLTGSTKGFSIDRASMTKPSSPAAKNYTGSSQGSGITCPSGSTTGGTTSATNAGTYSQTCSPDANHKWSDGTTSAATISWTIRKINPTLTQSATSGSATTGNTASYTISSNVAGSYKASSSNVNYATVSLSSTSAQAAGTKVTSTVKAVSVSSTAITITITFTPNDTTNYNAVSKTYSFTPLAITRTATFYANGNTLSTPSGCSTSGNNRVCSCKTTGSSTSCTVTAPTITAPSATPSVIGFSTSSTNRNNSASSGKAVSLINNPSYYAQTYKSAVAHTITWNANGATIGSTSSSCSIGATYNGTAQATGCNITSPSISRTGYTIYGWNTSSTASTSSWNVGVIKTVTSSTTYYAITKDTTAPNCGSWSGASTTWTSSNRTIYVGCSDSGSDCTQSNFSQTFSSNTKTANVSITIRDKAGNTAVCSKSVNVYIAKTSTVSYSSLVSDGKTGVNGSNGTMTGTIGQSAFIFQFGIENVVTPNLPNMGKLCMQAYRQSTEQTETSCFDIGSGKAVYTWPSSSDKRLESIRFWLTGDAANAYDVWYRTQIQTYGWLEPTLNGKWSGSQGLSKRMEAVQVRLDPKNEGGGNFSNHTTNCRSENFVFINQSNSQAALNQRLGC